MSANARQATVLMPVIAATSKAELPGEAMQNVANLP